MAAEVLPCSLCPCGHSALSHVTSDLDCRRDPLCRHRPWPVSRGAPSCCDGGLRARALRQSYSTRPRHVGKSWSHFSCLQPATPGDGCDTRQHVCMNPFRGMDYRLGVAPMDLIFKVGTTLTLNVFSLNCRKLFVGGLDWSTTQGRCRSRVPGAAGGPNLGLQVM